MNPNFRGLTRVNMIEVIEGEGTSISPKRSVRYFTDNEGVVLGKSDLGKIDNPGNDIDPGIIEATS